MTDDAPTPTSPDGTDAMETLPARRPTAEELCLAEQIYKEPVESTSRTEDTVCFVLTILPLPESARQSQPTSYRAEFLRIRNRKYRWLVAGTVFYVGGLLVFVRLGQ